MEILPGIAGSELDELRTLREDFSEENSLDLVAPNNTTPPFRIGIIPRGDANAYLKRLESMRAELGELLGRPVEILPMETFSAMIDAQTLRRIDLAFYSASAFVTADRVCRCVEPLIVPLAADGSAAFHAIIVTSSRSNLRNVTDLGGKRIVASSSDSIGGYRMQMASLISEGVDANDYFGSIEFVGSGREALRLVRDGLADAAFVWSSMNGSQANGYSRGPLARLVQSGEAAMSEFVIIWQSKPIAHGPVAILKSIQGPDRDAVKNFLMALPESDAATYDILDVYYGGGYREASLSDFRAVFVLADVNIRPSRKAVAGSPPPMVPKSEVRADEQAPLAAAAPATVPESEVTADEQPTISVPRKRPEAPALLLPQ